MCYIYAASRLSQTEIKTPIRIPATGLLDPEDNTKRTKSDLAGSEKGPCCACPKTEEEKNRDKDERLFVKRFENFLHNSIFLQRYGPSQSSRSSSLKEAKPCLKCATGRQPLCESDWDPSLRRSWPAPPNLPFFFVPRCTRGDTLSRIQSLLSTLVAFRCRSNSGAGWREWRVGAWGDEGGFVGGT